MRTAFLYTDKYFAYDYGLSHPLKIERLRMTYDLCNAYGLFELPDAELVESRAALESEIIRFHDPDYVDVLKRGSRGETSYDFAYGLGPGDNPVFPGLWEWSLLQAGATLHGAQLISEGKARIVFNIAGGLHHAGHNRASGFCYVNDPVLAVYHFVDLGKRVLYLDIDAHHGDGVQWAFYDDSRVMTVSFHQDGRTLFPGSGALDETGRGDGTGYAVNVPMLAGTDDLVFWKGFSSLVPRLMEAFKPDVVVSQLGVDAFVTDPLAELRFTTHAFSRVIAYLTREAPAWVALGGGGYDLANVARAWTLAWAIMNGVEPADDLPEAARTSFFEQGGREPRLRDFEYTSPRQEQCLEHMDRCLEYLERHVLPIIE